MCYTLCRRCCENAVAAGEGKGIFTAGKQGCDCVAWSRKRRTGFISRQGDECPRPSSYAELWDKVSQTDIHTYEKTDGFSFQNWNGREAILGLSRLVCLSAKTGGLSTAVHEMRRSSWLLTGSAGFAICLCYCSQSFSWSKEYSNVEYSLSVFWARPPYSFSMKSKSSMSVCIIKPFFSVSIGVPLSQLFASKYIYGIFMLYKQLTYQRQKK